MISYRLLLRFFKIEKKVCIRAIRNYINTLQQLALKSYTMTFLEYSRGKERSLLTSTISLPTESHIFKHIECVHHLLCKEIFREYFTTFLY